MATPVLEPAFTTGELAPSLFGRQDVALIHTAAATMRNMFASFKGGAYSRPGTRFVGWSAQFGRPFPPRLIPFQFSINQGLILEFGNFYMRVVQNGAFVTEAPIAIVSVNQATPGVVTITTFSGNIATPLNAGVVSSYSTSDAITLAGGTFSSPAVLQVDSTTLLSCAPLARGSGYAPGDTITLSGGVHTVAAVVTVGATRVMSVGIAAAGTGGTPGPATITGTTGAGTPFQANVTIGGGGAIASINSILFPGSYTANPTNLANEPVTGGGLSGAAVSLTMGVDGVSISTGGDYTVNAGSFGQASTSGVGTGATFQSALYGPLAVHFASLGSYSILPTNPVSQASTTGGGLGVQFNVTWNSGAASPLVTGDWVFISGVQGMTQLNGQTYRVAVTSPTTFQLFDVFGNPVDTAVFGAYTGGGTIARIFTIPTIYADADLEWLKFTQSADVMTLCCVNQLTATEYPPQDLTRFSDTDWTFTGVVEKPSIGAPQNAFGVSTAAGTTYYAYQVTAVASSDGSESRPSNIAYIDAAVDISVTAGTNTITWDTVPGAQQYNIYKAEPVYTGRPPVGVLFGFCGTAFGNQFKDSNIVSDFAQVPPTINHPFARGIILSAQVTSSGSGYTFATVAVNTGTGARADIEAVIVNGGVVALIVIAAGFRYQPTDTITITGDGTGAAGTITVGPETGTYPSVPNYFQQRRVFGNTLNQPDTYFMSQPGAFTNFDSRIPTIDTDAIIGSPWSLQVDGLQFFVLMPAGLATFTGTSAWLLVGEGSFATNVQPISPSSQVAQPLAFSGCSPTLPPIKINYEILYVSSKGSYYFDLPYQLYALSEPIDLTLFSTHLFDDFTFREHTWAEIPFKLLWTVRSDGCLLSLTYLKQQKVSGWTRHDTFGHFWSVASCVEPVIATPELGDNPPQKADAVYVVVERHPSQQT